MGFMRSLGQGLGGMIPSLGVLKAQRRKNNKSGQPWKPPTLDPYQYDRPEQRAETNAAIKQSGERAAGLGTFNAERFDQRFQPALERLNDSFTRNRRSVSEDLASRGIGHQGSFAAGDRNVGVSGPEGYEQSLVAERFGAEAGRTMRESMADSSEQDRADYTASLAVPQLMLQRDREQLVDPNEVFSGQTQMFEGGQQRKHESNMARTENRRRNQSAALGAGMGALGGLLKMGG